MRMIKRVLGAAAGFIVERWNEYTSFGQFLFLLACCAIIVDAGISWEYGISTTKWHAAGFALAAVAFAVLPDVSIMEAKKGNWVGALAIGVACIPLAVVALQSHLGYGSGVRLGDMQQTAFQHVKAENVAESLKSERANLEVMRAVMKSRREDNDRLRARNNGWAVTTKPEAMAAQVQALDKYIANEAARGGCKDKCQAKMKEKADVLALIEGIEKENDLTDKIKELQAKIDTKEKAVAETGYRSSETVNQVDTIAKLINIFRGVSADDAIKPTSAQREFTNIGTVGINSLGFMIMGVTLMAAAGMNRKPHIVAAWNAPIGTGTVVGDVTPGSTSNVAPQTSISDMFAARFAEISAKAAA